MPQDYSGSYGTNGFKLTFDSSQTNGIGHDSSGQGNHFTSSGFDTGDVALYSKDLSAQGGFLANMEPAKAFNGNLSNGAGGATNGGSMTFAPTTAITVTSSVSWYSNASTTNTSLTWNGTTVNRTSTGWTTINGSGVLSASNTFEWTGDGGGSTTVPTCEAIAIDGTATANILLDNTDNDVDYFDTPTSNYAIFSSIDAGQYIATLATMKDANLSATVSGTTIAPSTQVIPANGDFYAEFEVVVVENSTFVVGVTNLGEVTGKLGDLANNYPANSLSLSVPGTALFNFGSNTSISVAANQVGTIWGVRYNDGVVTFYRDGVQQQQATISSTDNRKGLRFFSSMASTGTYKANYGTLDMPFIYRPSGLTDNTELQTNNLPGRSFILDIND